MADSIDYAAVLDWKLAKEHVTGMIDTTLSDDVPEATGYRTALLQLLTTAMARDQAKNERIETQMAMVSIPRLPSSSLKILITSENGSREKKANLKKILVASLH